MCVWYLDCENKKVQEREKKRKWKEQNTKKKQSTKILITWDYNKNINGR